METLHFCGNVFVPEQLALRMQIERIYVAAGVTARGAGVRSRASGRHQTCIRHTPRSWLPR
jgi:hypothetical protein